jgi:hypothetical protein
MEDPEEGKKMKKVYKHINLPEEEHSRWMAIKATKGFQYHHEVAKLLLDMWVAIYNICIR